MPQAYERGVLCKDIIYILQILPIHRQRAPLVPCIRRAALVPCIRRAALVPCIRSNGPCDTRTLFIYPPNYLTALPPTLLHVDDYTSQQSMAIFCSQPKRCKKIIPFGAIYTTMHKREGTIEQNKTYLLLLCNSINSAHVVICLSSGFRALKRLVGGSSDRKRHVELKNMYTCVYVYEYRPCATCMCDYLSLNMRRVYLRCLHFPSVSI